MVPGIHYILNTLLLLLMLLLFKYGTQKKGMLNNLPEVTFVAYISWERTKVSLFSNCYT